MHWSSLGRLGLKHIRSGAAEALFLKTSLDFTRPVAIYGLVNQRCNARCRSCEFWRMKEYAEEISIGQWEQGLLSLREFVGRYSVNFSGGEPFLKPGFVDLLAFCHRHGIHAGVTTNGSCFTPEIVERLVAARPFNVNVSVDAPDAAMHDYLRGMPGLLDRLTGGLRRLIAARDAQGASFPVIIKPTVSAANLHFLPELVRWAEALGATSVNFQPLERRSPETYGELWIGEDRLDELRDVIGQLVAMRRRGAPILNTPRLLRLMAVHFREEKAPSRLLPCLVGLRSYFIDPSGSVKVCEHFDAVGNIARQSAREIWRGPKAEAVRRETLACRRLCSATCTLHKSFCDKLCMAWELVRGRRVQANGGNRAAVALAGPRGALP